MREETKSLLTSLTDIYLAFFSSQTVCLDVSSLFFFYSKLNRFITHKIFNSKGSKSNEKIRYITILNKKKPYIKDRKGKTNVYKETKKKKIERKKKEAHLTRGVETCHSPMRI